MSSDNPILGEQAQTIIDTHLSAIMRELLELGIKPLGVVAGVLHTDETSINWCVSDDAADEHGNRVPAEEVANIIAGDVYASTHPIDTAKDDTQLRVALLGELVVLEKRYGKELFWEDGLVVCNQDGSSFIDQVVCGDGYFSAIGYEGPNAKYYENRVYGRKLSVMEPEQAPASGTQQQPG